MNIEIKQDSNNSFEVKIFDDVITEHKIFLSDEYYEKLTKNKIQKKKLVKLSIFYLLEREKNTEILSNFELREISNYFSDYTSEVQKWCKIESKKNN